MNGADAGKMAELSAARRGARLPFVAGLAVIVIVALVVALLSAGDISIVSNTLLVALCLVPSIVCMLPLLIGAVAGIWALGRADSAVVQRLLKAEHSAGNVRERITETALTIGRSIIRGAAAVERLDPLLSVFDDQQKGRDDVPTVRPPDEPIE